MLSDKSYPSQLLSGKKGTRLILWRDSANLKPGQVILSQGSWWRVSGRIARTGDVVIEPVE